MENGNVAGIGLGLVINYTGRARQCHLPGSMVQAVGVVKAAGRSIKVKVSHCECVRNYAREFGSKEQNSSKGIYVMHPGRHAIASCLRDQSSVANEHSR
jgi:hypothetical protein